ncbi:MAG: hypothetical protein EOP04_20755 [Proteobacteria bacterium]|nr:MAG: hypothetical protein EOP04_20755 [Pseudomonadota bacterium]
MQSRDGKSSVSRTRTGAFRIRFYDEEGERRSINAPTATERDYILRTLRRRDPLDQWFPPDAKVFPIMKKRTFADLAHQFLEHRRTVKEISDSCYWNYETQLQTHILPVLGDIKLENLHLTDIEKLASKLKVTRPKTKSYVSVRRELFADDEFLSASYRKEILTLVCSVAKFGYLRDFMPTHPFKAFELPDTGDKPYDYWRIIEEDKFLDWLAAGGIYHKPHGKKDGTEYNREWKVWNHAKIYDVVLFTLRTGMRKGEVSGLAIEDIDFDLNLITVHSTWSYKEAKEKDTTKNGPSRH